MQQTFAPPTPAVRFRVGSFYVSAYGASAPAIVSDFTSRLKLPWQKAPLFLVLRRDGPYQKANAQMSASAPKKALRILARDEVAEITGMITSHRRRPIVLIGELAGDPPRYRLSGGVREVFQSTLDDAARDNGSTLFSLGVKEPADGGALGFAQISKILAGAGAAASAYDLIELIAKTTPIEINASDAAYDGFITLASPHAEAKIVVGQVSVGPAVAASVKGPPCPVADADAHDDCTFISGILSKLGMSGAN